MEKFLVVRFSCNFLKKIMDKTLNFLFYLIFCAHSEPLNIFNPYCKDIYGICIKTKNPMGILCFLCKKNQKGNVLQ